MGLIRFVIPFIETGLALTAPIAQFKDLTLIPFAKLMPMKPLITRTKTTFTIAAIVDLTYTYARAIDGK